MFLRQRNAENAENIGKFQKLLAFLKDMPYNIFRRLAIRRYTI